MAVSLSSHRGSFIPLILIATLLYTIILFFTSILIEQREEKLQHLEYKKIAQEHQNQTKVLIQAKREATMHLALALANDSAIKRALETDDYRLIDLKSFSKKLRENTPLKNVWFQIIDLKGESFYRSWTTKRGDYMLNARIDISEVMQELKPTSTISTGKFDMTFKAMVPILEKGQLIGIFEVIAKFNSIAKKMKRSGLEPVILVDKRYRQQIKHPFTKLFVNDYYVANLNANAELLNYFRSQDLKSILEKSEPYILDVKTNKFITLYSLDDVKNKPMGYFFYVTDLDQIDMTHIYEESRNIYIWVTVIYLFLVMFSLFIFMRRNTQLMESFNNELRKKVIEKTAELDEQREFLQEVINGVSDSVMVIDKDYNVILMNTVARQSYRGEMVADPAHPKCYEVSHHIQSPCDGIDHPCPLKETMQSKRSAVVLHNHSDANGKAAYFELTATPLFDADENVRAIIEVGHDVTQHLESQNLLREQKENFNHLAHHDILTQLPNRLLFTDRLEHAIEQSRRTGNQLILLFLDLDQFKQINDSLGHNAGDHLLREIAQRLKKSVRQEDTVARLGGDEFTVLIENCANDHAIIEILDKIIKAAAQVVEFEEHQLYTSASIGVSIYPQDGDSAESLLRNADAAMYKAKEVGRNTYQFYTADMTQKAMDRVVMESAIRRGIEKGEFFLEYQPQYDIRTDTFVGMEALVRWNHPDLGRLGPNHFIPICEESNLIIDLGEYVLDQAAAQVSWWYTAGYNPMRVAVNFSVKQLQQNDLIERLKSILERHNCQPEWIEVEVTEGYVMYDPSKAIARLQEIEQMGMVLAMDDFGTGYSSLSLLKQLPIHKLKIDFSFIRDIPGDEEDEAITCTIIDLARHMNLDVLAEGVEREDQKAFLLEHDCYHVQGYFYAKPMESEALSLLLRSMHSK